MNPEQFVSTPSSTGHQTERGRRSVVLEALQLRSAQGSLQVALEAAVLGAPLLEKPARNSTDVFSRFGIQHRKREVTDNHKNLWNWRIPL